MHKQEVRRALERYANKQMPENVDLWPRIQHTLHASGQAVDGRHSVRRRLRYCFNVASVAALLLLTVGVSMQLQGYMARDSAQSATTVSATVPMNLSLDEAIDIACFGGQMLPSGDMGYVGHQRQILTAEVSQGEAEQFIAAYAAFTPVSPIALDPSTPVYLIIVRGAVTNQLGGDERILGTSLAMVIDRQAHVTYSDISEIWNTVAPAGAHASAPRLAAKVNGVSIARAQAALNGTLRIPSTGMAGQTLQRVDIGRVNAQVDPSGTIPITNRSATAIYGNAAEPRLWLSQSDSPFQIGLGVPGATRRLHAEQGEYYGWHYQEQPMGTVVWKMGAMWFCLTAKLDAQYTEANLLAVAENLTMPATDSTP